MRLRISDLSLSSPGDVSRQKMKLMEKSFTPAGANIRVAARMKHQHRVALSSAPIVDVGGASVGIIVVLS